MRNPEIKRYPWRAKMAGPFPAPVIRPEETTDFDELDQRGDVMQAYVAGSSSYVRWAIEHTMDTRHPREIYECVRADEFISQDLIDRTVELLVEEGVLVELPIELPNNRVIRMFRFPTRREQAEALRRGGLDHGIDQQQAG